MQVIASELLTFGCTRPRLVLQSHTLDLIWPRTEPDNSSFFDFCGEFIVLREETISRMKQRNFGLDSRGDYSVAGWREEGATG